MKKHLFSFLMLLVISFGNQQVKAQDVCNSNPSYCRLLTDTAGIKMMMITLPKGARLVSHTHSVNIGYVLKGGLYKWTYEDNGKTYSARLKPGEEFHGGPESPHHSWNAGE